MIAYHVISPIQGQQEQSETLRCCHDEKSMKDVGFCVELMLKNTVFVNAMSSNHFTESYNMVGSFCSKCQEHIL